MQNASAIRPVRKNLLIDGRHPIFFASPIKMPCSSQRGHPRLSYSRGKRLKTRSGSTVRIVMVVGFVIAAVLAGARDSAFAQEIKISHQWAEGTDGRDRATRVFVQEVEARAKGLKFRV